MNLRDILAVWWFCLTASKQDRANMVRLHQDADTFGVGAVVQSMEHSLDARDQELARISAALAEHDANGTKPTDEEIAEWKTILGDEGP